MPEMKNKKKSQAHLGTQKNERISFFNLVLNIHMRHNINIQNNYMAWLPDSDTCF